jgi:hypothetical protein
VVNELAERNTAEFFRTQAERLKSLAALTREPTIRLELFEMAAVFQRMAERTTAQKNRAVGVDAEPA